MAQTLALAGSADSLPAQDYFPHMSIYSLDGRLLSTLYRAERFDIWPAVVDRIAEDHDCDPDDVGLSEADEDAECGCDVITVAGNDVAYLYDGFGNPPEPVSLTVMRRAA